MHHALPSGFPKFMGPQNPYVMLCLGPGVSQNTHWEALSLGLYIAYTGQDREKQEQSWGSQLPWEL